jgi:hypothetical protein
MNSTVFVAGVSLAAGLASIIGAGAQEAYQLLLSVSAVFVVSGYLVLFLIPLAGFRHTGVRFPLWPKAASVSGLTVVIGFLALSVLPIVAVGNTVIYSLKVAGIILAANALAVAVYWRGAKLPASTRRCLFLSPRRP